jgi:hypothetical protein
MVGCMPLYVFDGHYEEISEAEWAQRDLNYLPCNRAPLSDPTTGGGTRARKVAGEQGRSLDEV